MEATTNKIFSKIKEDGFANAARILSIANSSKDGGNIGWVNENKLSKIIYEQVKNLKNGEMTEPILTEGVVIFIKKIDEKKYFI